MITRICLVIVSCLLAFEASAAQVADVSLIVSDRFGKPFQSVRVVKFSTPAGADLSQQFKGLKAASVPYGSYLVEIEADRTGMAEHVEVNKPVVSATISGGGWILETTKDLELRVRVERIPATASRPVWLKLVPLYGGTPTEVGILDKKDECSFFNLETGVFAGILLNHDGVLGVSTVRVDRPTGVTPPKAQKLTVWLSTISAIRSR